MHDGARRVESVVEGGVVKARFKELRWMRGGRRREKGVLEEDVLKVR